MSQKKKLCKERKLQNKEESWNQDGFASLDPRPLRRRCSCGCDPSPTLTTGSSYGSRPKVEVAGRGSRDCGGWCYGCCRKLTNRTRQTDSSLSGTGYSYGGENEVEITRSRDDIAAVQLIPGSRDGVVPGNTHASTGNTIGMQPEVETEPRESRDGQNIAARVSRVKPAIEMNRQQILQVYVLNDNRGGRGDVRDHVTSKLPGPAVTAAAKRRAMSQFRRILPISFAAASKSALTSDSTSPDVVNSEAVSSFYRRRNFQPFPTSEQTHSSKRSETTESSPFYQDKPSQSGIVSLHPVNTYQPYYICSASVDRKRGIVAASKRSTSHRKPITLYSSSDASGKIGLRGAHVVRATASLDRGNFQCFRKNRNFTGTTAGAGDDEGKERVMLSETVDDDLGELYVAEARGRTKQRKASDVHIITPGSDGVLSGVDYR